METEIKKVVLENNWLSSLNVGWGNGYVVIPKGHKLHGVHYDNIEGIDVHGGLTFSECADKELIKTLGLSDNDLGSWVIGFDTCHYADNKMNWPKYQVELETQRLLEQVINL